MRRSSLLQERVISLGANLEREDLMQRPGLTIFIIFFGIATLDALTDGRWPRIAFWLAMGTLFALLDRWGQRKRVTRG